MQNKHLKAIKYEVDSKAKKKHSKNKMNKLKSQIPLKSRKIESPITVITKVEGEVDYDEIIPFNMPFSKRLIKIQVPKQLWQLPTVDLYNGSTNPNDYLSAFESTLSYKGTSDAIMCHTFPLSLKSIVLKWFQSLPPRSIDLWLDLREKFRPAFATNKERLKMKTDIYGRDSKSHRENTFIVQQGSKSYR